MFRLASALIFGAAVAKHEFFASMQELCAEAGFASESYTVETSDGYMLGLYRIPGQFSDESTGKKPAVLFMPGQDADMFEYVMNTPDKNPAMVTSRAGYDVWMGNNRGTRFSVGHKTLDTSSKAFWNYYQEDLALQDLPALIDFILAKTGLENISYVGHSMGTNQLFLGGALNPSYFTPKINVAVMLGPVGSTANIPTKSIRLAAKNWKKLEFLATHVLHKYNWNGPMPLGDEALDTFCSLTSTLCSDAAKFLWHHHGVDNADLLSRAAAHVPSGAGWRTFVYWAQQIESGRFALYDYGKRGNKKKYGNEVNPLVPMGDYAIPTGLFSGTMDNLANAVDVKNLNDLLGKNSVAWNVYDFDHLSFAVAKDMSYWVNDALPLFQKYNPVSPSEFLQ